MKRHTASLVVLFFVLLMGCSPEVPDYTEKMPTPPARPDTVQASAPVADSLPKPEPALVKVFKSYGLVDIHELDTSIRVDLRYGSTNNFLKRDMYEGLRTAFFNCETALKLSNAQHYLKQSHPGYSLIVFDAARPHRIQRMMWDSLKMPPEVKFNYLSPPEERSMHNLGCAADVSIVDLSTGQLLDMGTDFDFFGKLSAPIYEAAFLKSGELSREAWKNRLVLRRTMHRAGFISINTEWWHFSSYGKAAGMAKFKLIE